MAMVFFVNGVVVGSWLPRLPEIRDRLGIDLGALGLTLALGGVGSLVGSSLSGVTVGRFGARRSAVAAGVVLYLILPFIAVAPTATVLAVVLATMGFIDAQADVGMNAVGIRVEEAVGRSIMTRLHGLWSLGTLVGAGASALFVLAGIDLLLQLVILAVLGLITTLVAARLVPESPPRAAVGQRSGTLAIGLMLAGGTAVFIEGSPFEWSAIFLSDVVGATAALAGAGVILFTGGMLTGRLAGDHLVDRFGAVPTLFAGFVISVAAMLGTVTTSVVGVALVGFAFWGLGISVVLPVLYKLAGGHESFAEGSGLAALTVGTRLGVMVSPALIGVAATAWGLPTALAVVVGVAAVASMLVIRLTLGSGGSVRDSLQETGVS
ncbi:MAG TPA: hypothetical protein VLS86_00070 [Acidimicrobiia bacterium]|nr:hypothetical protein [Acidimicrobiia bacterium]